MNNAKCKVERAKRNNQVPLLEHSVVVVVAVVVVIVAVAVVVIVQILIVKVQPINI